ncbi:MAG: WG repeat-containing protein [Chitinophagales bacterium]|nr:WG repeat-containing protein [Chitinophagales bacterium]
MKKLLTTALLCLVAMTTTQAQTFFKDANGKWGLKDKAGNVILPGKYDKFWGEFSEGLASVSLNGKWGFIDTTGKEVIPLKYDDAGNFSEGLVVVGIFKEKGASAKNRGYLDKTGREVIPLKYDVTNAFKNGKAKVSLNGREFYIDKTGKEVK